MAAAHFLHLLKPMNGCRSRKVVSVASYGVFVEVLSGLDGLVHISELETGRGDPDKYQVGDTIDVKCLEVQGCSPILP